MVYLLRLLALCRPNRLPVVWKVEPHARQLGFYGFGAAAHILIQIALHEGKEVYAFTRDGDTDAQAFAKLMGAVWAGDSSATPPLKLDAAIIFCTCGRACAKSAKGY